MNRIPYTYCITHKPSGKRYYGSRYGKNCHPSDLWVNYFTSSKIVKNLIALDGAESFDYEVRRVFDNAKDAVKWEHKVLVRLGIPRNSKWLNRYSGVSLTAEEMALSILNKYGVSHVSQIPGHADNVKAAVLEKYGVDSVFKLPSVKEKVLKKFRDYYDNVEPLVCPVCGTNSKSVRNMKTYHFEKCIFNTIKQLHELGYSPKQIANKLNISVKRAKNNIFKFSDIVNKAVDNVEFKENHLYLFHPNRREVLYNGVVYTSLRRMSEMLGKSRNYIKRLLSLGEAEYMKGLK